MVKKLKRDGRKETRIAPIDDRDGKHRFGLHRRLRDLERAGKLQARRWRPGRG